MTVDETRPRASSALRSELTAFLVELWHDIDHNAGRRASTFFAPDAELRFSDARFHGRDEIARVYADRAARGPRVSRHLVMNLHVLDSGQESVRAISALVLFGDDGEAPRPITSPALVADVIDELERHDDGWLITSRWIKYLFIEPVTELAVPGE
jgi:hypothetical protein